MSLIATVCIGDTSLSVYKVQSLDIQEDQETKFSYTLSFVDLPTAKKAYYTTFSEKEAMDMFASWLLADTALPDVLNAYNKFKKGIDDRLHLFFL